MPPATGIQTWGWAPRQTLTRAILEKKDPQVTDATLDVVNKQEQRGKQLGYVSSEYTGDDQLQKAGGMRVKRLPQHGQNTKAEVPKTIQRSPSTSAASQSLRDKTTAWNNNPLPGKGGKNENTIILFWKTKKAALCSNDSFL